jgi:hypothetical protein
MDVGYLCLGFLLPSRSCIDKRRKNWLLLFFSIFVCQFEWKIVRSKTLCHYMCWGRGMCVLLFSILIAIIMHLAIVEVVVASCPTINMGKEVNWRMERKPIVWLAVLIFVFFFVKNITKVQQWLHGLAIRFGISYHIYECMDDQIQRQQFSHSVHRRAVDFAENYMYILMRKALS